MKKIQGIYKKSLAICVVLALLVTCLNMAFVTSAETTVTDKYVTRFDFEDTTANQLSKIATTSGGTVSIAINSEEETIANGNKSLCYTFSSQYSKVYLNAENGEFAGDGLSLWIKSAANVLNLYVRYKDTDGTIKQTSIDKFNYLPLGGTGVGPTHTVDYPDTIDKASVIGIMIEMLSASGIVYIDDVKVKNPINTYKDVFAAEDINANELSDVITTSQGAISVYGDDADTENDESNIYNGSASLKFSTNTTNYRNLKIFDKNNMGYFVGESVSFWLKHRISICGLSVVTTNGDVKISSWENPSPNGRMFTIDYEAKGIDPNTVTGLYIQFVNSSAVEESIFIDNICVKNPMKDSYKEILNFENTNEGIYATTSNGGTKSINTDAANSYTGTNSLKLTGSSYPIVDIKNISGAFAGTAVRFWIKSSNPIFNFYVIKKDGTTVKFDSDNWIDPQSKGTFFTLNYEALGVEAEDVLGIRIHLNGSATAYIDNITVIEPIDLSVNMDNNGFTFERNQFSAEVVDDIDNALSNTDTIKFTSYGAASYPSFVIKAEEGYFAGESASFWVKNPSDRQVANLKVKTSKGDVTVKTYFKPSVTGEIITINFANYNIDPTTVTGIAFEFNSSGVIFDFYVDNVTVNDIFDDGDANADGVFNVKDIVRAKKYIAQVSNSIAYYSVDLDGNAEVNALDLVELNKLLLQG